MYAGVKRLQWTWHVARVYQIMVHTAPYVCSNPCEYGTNCFRQTDNRLAAQSRKKKGQPDWGVF